MWTRYPYGMASSTHYRRRWYYALWLCLLGCSITALVLWETPARSGTAELRLVVELKGAPTPCLATTWSGPRRDAKKIHTSTDSQPLMGPIDRTFKLPVAYRRWMKLLIPRKTADLIVIKCVSQGGAPKYLSIPLEYDWEAGILKPGRKTTFKLSADWKNLGDSLEEALAPPQARASR